MPQLSAQITIRGKIIKNRIVMPPMVCFSFQGDQGGVYGKQHIEHYTQRAKGGTGLIIVQATRVLGAVQQVGVWSREQRGPLEAIALNCHAYGSVAMMQLSCGDLDINKLSAEQIRTIQEDCIAAAAIARQAGFDGAEYHFAHGFALCKFLDPDYNKRTDEYGGPLQNRIRIIAEIIPQIRKAVGEDFILGIRMGGNIPDVSGAIEVAQAWEEAGIDLLHISFGMKKPENTVPNDFPGSTITFNGSQIKKHVHIPVIGVYEIFTSEDAKYLIEKGHVDLVAVGRGSFADENWANKVLAGEPVNQCNNCGGNERGCFWFFDHTLCPARNM